MFSLLFDGAQARFQFLFMRDVATEVVPNVTHWQSPRNLAYFSSTASGIGILGELVSSALNANAFIWRVSPVGISSTLTS